MNRRNFIKKNAGIAMLLGVSPALFSCREVFYTKADFADAPKIDVHFHFSVADAEYLRYAHSIGMHLVTVNVDAGESIDEQLDIAIKLKKYQTDRLDFLGTFSVDNFGKDCFVEQAISRIDKCMNAGAKGIKIWKNIGMELKDNQGRYVMADHPAFDPVFTYLERQGIPLMAHLGEPKSCWLPFDQMSFKSSGYYKQNPQYYMYLHPDKPSYEQHITARDHLLAKYPELIFIGAHIGSLEWNLDEVAKRFDAYPNFTVDLAARMQDITLHALNDRQKLIDFLITYQDRILYGSDTGIGRMIPERKDERYNNVRNTWLQQWQFIATDDVIPTNYFALETAPKEMKGLRLPRSVVNKIFYKNTRRILKI